MGPVLLGAGVALLALSVWWRTEPAPGGSRWWTAEDTQRRAALLVLPGIGLGLVSAWPIASYDEAMAALGGEAWKLWFVVPALVGALLAFWGMLWLPIPRWITPRWFRARQQAAPDQRRAARPEGER